MAPRRNYAAIGGAAGAGVGFGGYLLSLLPHAATTTAAATAASSSAAATPGIFTAMASALTSAPAVLMPVLVPVAIVGTLGAMAGRALDRRAIEHGPSSLEKVMNAPYELAVMQDKRQHEADKQARKARLSHERQLLELTAGALLVTGEAEKLSARKDLQIQHEKDMAALELQRVKDSDAIRLEMLKKGVVLPQMEFDPRHQPGQSRWEKFVNGIKSAFSNPKKTHHDALYSAINNGITPPQATPVADHAHETKTEQTGVPAKADAPEPASSTTSPQTGPVIHNNNYNIALDGTANIGGTPVAAITEQQAEKLVQGFMERPEVQQTLNNTPELSPRDKIALLKQFNSYMNEVGAAVPAQQQAPAPIPRNEADEYTLNGRTATVQHAGAEALQAYLKMYLATQTAPEQVAVLSK